MSGITKTTRIGELDALRGLAALAVVLYHFLTLYGKRYGHSFEPFEFLALGATGVNLFFIISGFVILWSLSRAKTVGGFVWGRFSRLYPAYWIAVLFTFTVVSLAGPSDREVSLSTALYNLTMFHEYLGMAHVDGVYWTLSIELAFYILASTAFALGLLRVVDWLCLAWASVALGINLSSVSVGVLEQALLLDWCHLFIAGMCFFRITRVGWSTVLCVVLLLSFTLNWVVASTTTAAVVSAFYLVFIALLRGHLRFLNARPLLWLGAVSYSLYIIHQNIGYSIINAGYAQGFHPAISIMVALVVSLLLAAALHHWVEQPALRYLRARKPSLPLASSAIVGRGSESSNISTLN